MKRKHSITGRLIVKNAIFNLIGQALPIIAAILGVPILIKYLGVERFGILSLLWMIMWYSTMLDLGLGRSTTKFIADALANSKFEQIPKIFWTSALVQMLLGIFIGLIFFILTPTIVEKFLKITPVFIQETKISFYIISISTPIVLVNTSFQGVLEAYQRFDLVNAVLVPVKVGVLVLSIIGALLNFKLHEIVVLLISMRVLMLFVLFLLDLKICPDIGRRFDFEPQILPSLLSFGWWVSVINVLNPVLVYADRFLIGAILSASVLAYYTAPFEIVQRLWIIPASLNMTLFPAFSSLSGDEQRENLNSVFSKAVKLTFIVLFPLVFTISVFSSEILKIWLGSEFADKSSEIFKILAFGILLNSLAGFPAILLQGVGRPDLTAKVYIAELIFYLPFVSILIYKLGIIGAGIGWLTRQVIDSFLLYGIIFRRRIVSGKDFWNGETLHILLFSTILILFIFVSNVLNIWLKLSVAILSIAMFMFIAWFKALNQQERQEVKLLIKIK